ncbi:single-stranded-DNA-specific exonuclease RecJ [Neokomagataea thailandica NBRC 106555]|uniref:Single-stranded-DNA-specific exonuclease RecJ n=2 Tax=Neokomagataea TaxID=1223423 RepID=A0A4Y6V7R8_9PROT|nr:MULTISPECIES: single-stranded-DNA-specific exonuclease RecJ [Neokomagataea]QDH24681.1 single-stranded-DNA-specific exonuclease RecJ [Neokomagataea tanensis]GBR53849.1 single-stranded-DNA-specific exonuclease RecJ [Neokomagataea thailandica NBRC 106555]
MTDTTRCVLGVDHSAGGRQWVWRDASLGQEEHRVALGMAQRLGIPELLARILSARGITAETAETFLTPRLRDLMPDPSCLKDMDKAALRLAEAVTKQETVGLFGDYDVDGACGTALMADFLRQLGCGVQTHIPDRITEGYGPNVAALERMISGGASIIICIDCGTAAVSILDEIAQKADVIVLDHHKPDGAMLPRGIVVNPNRLDCDSGLGSICAAAVVFMTMTAVTRALRRSGWFQNHREPNLMGALDLTALATICDVMPLVGLNRAFVQQGLKVMARGERLGLVTLSAVAGVREDASAMSCGFALGPRINAGGRIAKADLGLNLLLAEDQEVAQQLAEELDQVNRQRQTVESDILDYAMEHAGQQVQAGHAVIFLHKGGWHPGVVGIVAGRIKEKFNRPVLVGALTEGVIKGSARSVPGLDLGAAIIAARQSGLLLTGGGHAMAAGFSVAEEKADELHSLLDETLSAARELPPRDALKIDGVVNVRGASLDVAKQLERLSPFGPGNEEPLLVVQNVRCVKADRIGRDGNTMRVLLRGEDGGVTLKGLVFRAGDADFAGTLEDKAMPLLHVVGQLRPESWQGRENVTFFIVDAKKV